MMKRLTAVGFFAIGAISSLVGSVRSASGAIVNLALSKPATATSSAAGTNPGQAVDGIGVGGANHPAEWHSGNDVTPTLTVDLGNVYNLGDDSPVGNPDVTLSNRTDACCTGRLTNLRFQVFDAGGTGGTPVYSVDFDPAGAITYSLELPAVQGRYFTLSKLNAPTSVNDDNRSINLAEIQVFGDSVPVPEPTTLSLLGLGAVGLLSRRRRRA